MVKLDKVAVQDFQTLVLSQAEELAPFAILLTRNQDRARDLCQETLCKAFVYRDRYEAGSNIRAWLFTIMRNIFINDYRRAKRKKKALETVRNFEPLFQVSVKGSVRLKEIRTALFCLPETFKTAFVLYQEGYQYQEIADALREPLGTIKSRIHFARKLLQKQIEK